MSSDTVVLGTIIEKSYGSDALINYDDSNSSNPCNLETTTTAPQITIDDSIPFSQRVQTITKETDAANFLKESEFNAPFKIKLKIDTLYKGNVTDNEIDVYGFDAPRYKGQFSRGYVINPEIGEQVLLYTNHRDELEFGSCTIEDVYAVHSTQGSIWGWNYDNKPDIYPGDVSIPPFKEQLNNFKTSYMKSGNGYPLSYDHFICPLGKQLVFKIHDIFDTPICVKLTTAEKLEQRGLVKPIDASWDWREYLMQKILNSSANQNVPSIVEEVQDDLNQKNNNEEIPWLYGVEDLSYLKLEKILNPTGYWTPIEDHNAFAELLASAVGHKITEDLQIKSQKTDYYTENGGINIRQNFTTSYVGPPVDFQIYRSFSSMSEEIEFISNFMDNMSFKIGNGHTLTQELLDSCEVNFAFHKCEFDDNSTITRTFVGDRVIYRISQPYSDISFVLYGEGIVKYGYPGIEIKFYGWTNNPELVEFTLDEKDAMQIARDFAKANDELNNTTEQWRCEFEFWEGSPSIGKSVISGVPFYDIRNGQCTYDYFDTGHYDLPIIQVEGRSGDFVFLSYVPDLD